MSLFVLDTDLLTLYYRGDPVVVRGVDARPPTELAISVMTVDEQLTGWYTLTRQARRSDEIARAYAHLGDSVVRLANWRILPYTEPAIARVAQLKALRLNQRSASQLRSSARKSSIAVLSPRAFPGLEAGSRNHRQSRLLEPAGDHRPVPVVTVTVHRVLTLDRVAIEPADHSGSPRRAIQCPAHGVDASGPNVEPP